VEEGVTMTVLRNTIHIAAPPERVWAVLAGTVLDALFVRRKWDAGIRSFFAGLKRYVEARDIA
jgi:hypothetical protein